MGNWTSLIIFILAFGLPAIGALWKKLEEQREKHRIEQLREEAKREQLRTGPSTSRQAQVGVAQSTAPVGQASAEQVRRERIAEIAARRRAQLEEFRRRQQQRLGQAQTSTARTASQRTPLPPPPPLVGGRQAQIDTSPIQDRPSTGKTVRDRIEQRAHQKKRQQAQAARDRRVQQQAANERRPRQDTTKRRSKPAAPHARQAAQRANAGGLDTVHALDHAPNMPKAQPIHQARILGKTMTRQDWRRAIVLAEVFAPPLAMRPPSEGSAF